MDTKIVLLKLNDKKVLPTLPKAMNVDNQRKLESEFKPGTRDCIRGLTPKLETIILPNILGVQAHDVNFAQRTKEFWADYSVQPTPEGIQLNVATTKKKVKNDAGELEEIDFPVSPEDWIVYQIALQSTRVAKVSSDADVLDNFDFYLVDLAAEEDAKRTEFQLAEQADTAYIKLISAFKENESKINWLLEWLRDKTQSVDVESLDELGKKMMLKKIKDAKPKDFYSSTEDKNLENKALIIRLLTYGVISKEGNTYFWGDEAMGNGGEAIAWLKKPESSGKLLAMQERLKVAIETKKI